VGAAALASGGVDLRTTDYHTAGEPFRIVLEGAPQLPGATVAERRANALESAEAQAVRRFLCHEPRGHADMYGGFVVEPDDAGAELGVLFWHKDGFSTACGHGTIALGAWAVESGRVEAPVDVIGDVTLVAHVTYFVPHIKPFIEKLIAQTRRRVIIAIGSVPPPNQGADLYEMVEGEPLARVPDQRVLLPVLWDLGILPEVRIAGSAASTGMGPRAYATREDAIAQMVRGAAGESAELGEKTRRIVESRFGELFRESADGGFERATESPRLLLITWEV